MRLFKNKKGDEGVSEQGSGLGIVLGVIFAVVLILAATPMPAKVMSLLKGEIKSDAVVQQFEELYNTISTATEETSEEVTLRYDLDYYIVGFAPNTKIKYHGLGLIYTSIDGCGDVACLCLYKKDEKIDCLLYDDRTYFVSENIDYHTNPFFTSDDPDADVYFNYYYNDEKITEFDIDKVKYIPLVIYNENKVVLEVKQINVENKNVIIVNEKNQ